MEKLGVRARNVLSDTTSKQFWCPGSTLKVNFDTAGPLAYGMPKEGLALYLQGDPVFQITPGSSNEKYSVIVSYQDRDLLQSGWLVGEKNITGKAAMISAEMARAKWSSSAPAPSTARSRTAPSNSSSTASLTEEEAPQSGKQRRVAATRA